MESKFKKVCVEKGLTARMIEEKTGIKRKTVYSWYNGSRYPSRPARILLRDKLGIDTSKIFD